MPKLTPLKRIKNDSEEDDDLSPMITEDIVQVHPLGYEYIINLDTLISEPQFYRPIITALKSATKTDKVTIHIATPGGDLTTAQIIIDYMHKCKAMITGIIYEACSAGSLIALNCDIIEVAKNGMMFIHGMGCGTSGNVQTMETQSKFYNSQNKDIMTSTYKNFLSSKEIEDVLKGGEIWLKDCDIKKHLKNWVPLIKEK